MHYHGSIFVGWIQRTTVTGKRIYLLEDDTGIQDILQIILKSQGYEVRTFGTVADFLGAIELSLPDLCILDVSLPDGNGLELSTYLSARTTTSQVPVLLMSADFRNQHRYRQSGAWDFINKPFDLKVLLTKVGQLI